jgi:hypothetical protein
MIEKAIHSSEWIMIDIFEALQPRFVSLTETMKTLKKKLDNLPILSRRKYYIAHIGGIDTPPKIFGIEDTFIEISVCRYYLHL